MRNPTLPLLVIALGGTAAAQPKVTSPAGYLAKEANSYYYSWMGYNGSTTSSTQHATIDNSLTGTPRPGIKAVHWRRDGNYSNNSGFVARKTTMAMRMAHGDWSKTVYNKFSKFSTSVLKGAWTTVYRAKPTSMPDWSKKPPSAPAPWSMKAMLDAPFSYNGNDALLYNWRSVGSTAARKGHPVDRAYKRGYNFISGTSIGTGCKAGGQSRNMYARAYWYIYPAGQRSRFYVQSWYGPKNQDTMVAIGLKNPNTPLPGLCTRLYSSAEAVVNIGKNTRTVKTKSFYFNFQPGFLGAQLHVQSFGLDPSQTPNLPIALSRGYRTGKLAGPPVLTEKYAGSAVGTGVNFTDSVYFRRSQAIITGLEN